METEENSRSAIIEKSHEKSKAFLNDTDLLTTMIRGNMNSITSFITLLTVFLVIVYNIVKLAFSKGYENNLLYRNVSQFCLFGSL